ncbi:MAG: serine hydrolase domain-containing protein [Bryobacteraceae bacterium]
MTRRALVFLVALPALAQLPAGQIAAIESFVSAEMAREGIPGGSLAVAVNGRLQYSNGFGFSDVENQVPAKAATVYRLASISKPVTATAVMQLAERGKIDLDADVRKYVPAFPRKQWTVTVRQLLSHLGGIRHYRDVAEANHALHFENLTEALRLFKDDPLLFEPGTRSSYSTYGFNLLGCAVEAASGMPFVDYLRTHIFAPARMDTMRDDSVHDIIPNRAQGYRKAGGVLQNSPLADTSGKIPGGGLCSTAADLARFGIALQSGALLREDTLAKMWTESRTREGKGAGYGLGWSIGQWKTLKLVSHGGGQARVATMLWLIPERRFALAWMCNLEGSRAGIPNRVAEIVLE